MAAKMEWTTAVLFFTFFSLLVATSRTEVKAMENKNKILEILAETEIENKILENKILEMLDQNKMEMYKNQTAVYKILDKMKALDMSDAILKQKQKELTMAKEEANYDAKNYLKALHALMTEQMRYRKQLNFLLKLRCNCVECTWKWQWLNNSWQWLNNSSNMLNQKNLTEEEIDEVLKQEQLLEQDSQLEELECKMVMKQMKTELTTELTRKQMTELARMLEEDVRHTLKALDQAYQLSLETTVMNCKHQYEKLQHHYERLQHQYEKLMLSSQELKIYELYFSILCNHPNTNAEHQEKQNARAGATGSKSKRVVAPLMAMSTTIAFLALFALYLHRRRQGIACTKGP